MESPRKAFRTKYVLTAGIEEIAVIPRGRDANYVKIPGTYGDSLKLGRDVFYDRADAVKDADRRRKERLASLERQCARIRALDLT